VTLDKPLEVRLTKMPDSVVGYAASGTPADCARLGFTTLAKSPIDLVISGINSDHNLGYDTNYSGTVAAALEAAGAGFPALAASVEYSEDCDFDGAANILTQAVDCFFGWSIPIGVIVNLNIPKLITKPNWVWTTLNLTPVADYYQMLPSQGQELLYLRLRQENSCLAAEGSDLALFRQGYITLTPVVALGHHQSTLFNLQSPREISQDLIKPAKSA
jgi:5'-nucleotidase